MTVIGSNALAGASGQGGGGYEIERSLRFNSGDSAYLNRTPSSAGNLNKYTWSGWVKKTTTGTGTYYLLTAVDGSNADILGFEADKLNWYNSYSGGVTSTDKLRDPSAWYHIVFSVDSTQSTAADRVKMYINGRQLTSFSGTLYPSLNRNFAINGTVAHKIGQYFTTNSSDFYLADINFIDGQGLAASDFGEYDDNNVWQPKKYAGTYGTNGFHLDFSNTSSNSALGTDSSGNGNSWSVNNLSVGGTAVGTEGWAVQTGGPGSNYNSGTAATLSSGTSWSTNGNNNTLGIDTNALGTHTITFTRVSGDNIDFFSSSSASSFGSRVTNSSSSITISSTGSSQSHSYSRYVYLGGSGGGNVTFSVSGTALGVVDSGNDSLRDSPTNGDPTNDTGAGGEVVGNYCTLNPLTNHLVLSNGNLTAVNASAAHNPTYGSFGFSSGKWYWEYTKEDALSSSGTSLGIGVVEISNSNKDTSLNIGGVDNHMSYLQGNATYYDNNTYPTATTVPGGLHASGTWMFAYDIDNAKAWIGKDGTWFSPGGTSGNPVTGANPIFTNFTAGKTYVPFLHMYSASTVNVNFGQRSWKYAAPSGFKALCTANLPDPTIADGSTAFEAKLWTGNGSTQNITGYNFSPDLVWTKQRNSSGFHALFDPIRGVHNALRSSSSGSTYTDNGLLTAFNSDGFSLGSAGDINGSSSTYVGWAWDGGSSNTTIAVGGLNSSLYDQSQTWSTYGTFTNTYTGNYDWPGVFNDGDEWDDYGSMYTDGTAKWTLTSPIACSNTVKIRVRLDNTDCSFTINEGLTDETTIAVSGTGYQHLETSFSGNISNFQSNSPGSGGIYVMKIYVDGKALIDSGTFNVPTIASTVRANPSAGFSICTYTGNGSANQTIGHGLNSKPSLVIIKSRDQSRNWIVIPTFINDKHFFYLNDTSELLTSLTSYYGTHTSSFVGITGSSSGSNSNASGEDYLCLAFAPVEGYSAFGTYVGNGLSSGPFVFTGMRPAFILTKGVDDAEDWYIRDTVRSPSNEVDESLRPNDNGSEYSGRTIDILSNGFKITDSDSQINQSGKTYLYVAFAEHPFKTARAR